MFRNMNSNILFNISAYFSSSFFSYKAAEATDINIFAFCKSSFTSLNMVSSVTKTSTLGIPVFSEIWLTRSAFLIVAGLSGFDLPIYDIKYNDCQ